MNHRLPSGPAVMCDGWRSGIGRLNSVTTPAGVIRPIRLPRYSVNHRLPSGPAVIPNGSLSNENPGVTPPVNSVTTPAGVTRPIRPGLATSVNQTLPSGPSAISRGKPLAEKFVPPVATVLTSPVGRDLRDPPRIGLLDEPQIAVGPDRDPRRIAVERRAETRSPDPRA